jgi:hypothetical protein
MLQAGIDERGKLGRECVAGARRLRKPFAGASALAAFSSVGQVIDDLRRPSTLVPRL